MTRRLTLPVVILITIGLVATAFAIRLTVPSREDRQAPFIATARFGESVEGRDLVLTPEDAYLADRVTTSSWTGETEGVWLIVDATIGSKVGIATPYATMTIDGVQYTSSDRPDEAALGGSVDPGLPQSGSFVFEVPTSAVEGAGARHAVIRFATAFQVRLDSAIELTLDLTSLRHETTASLLEPGLVLP